MHCDPDTVVTLPPGDDSISLRNSPVSFRFPPTYFVGPKTHDKIISEKIRELRTVNLQPFLFRFFFLYSIISVVKFVKIFFFLNILPSGVALAFFLPGVAVPEFIFRHACLTLLRVT